MDYTETPVTASTWTRWKSVTVVNPLIGDANQHPDDPAGPAAFFQEEKVVSVPDRFVRLDAGFCRKDFSPADTITMLNPETGVATGTTVTHSALYAILFSLYMQTALERDAAL